MIERITNTSLDATLLGSSVLAWLSATGVLLLIMVAVAIAKWLVTCRIARIAERTPTQIDDAAVDGVRAVRHWLVFLVAVFIASRLLELPDRVDGLLRGVAVVAVFLQVGLCLGRGVRTWISRSTTRALERDAGSATGLAAMKFIGLLLMWSVLLLLMLDNLGVDITALIAGLGIGGIAVALAVQNILGDLFASLSIVIDKPFVIGDFIVVDDFAGTVEHVGLKTTRIRSLGGEQLVFSNSDLLATRVRNYKRMKQRRIVFAFGVLYQTTPQQLERIPGIVREIIDGLDRTRFDRAHFKGFGDSAYEFEVVYWMEVPDFNSYMDSQQEINLALVRAFAEHGVEFAYPTRTVHLAGPVAVEGRSVGAAR